MQKTGNYIMSSQQGLKNMPKFNYYISNIGDGNIGFNNYCSPEDTILNRDNLMKKFGFSLNNLVAMRQVHSRNVELIDSSLMGRGARSPEDAIIDADAMITSTKGIVLMAQSADCSLISIYDSVNSVIGVVHAGWRGVVNGIVPKTIDIMKKNYGSSLENLRVIISPHAHVCCYEVGEELRKEFYMFPEEIYRKDRAKLFIDIEKALHWQINSYGVPSNNILPNNICTICNEQYFSYRRQGIVSAGRFGMFVWME